MDTHHDKTCLLKLKPVVTNQSAQVLSEYVTLFEPRRDQVRLKPACSATGTSQGLAIMDIASIDIMLCKQGTTKALIRLRGCAS